MFCDTIILTEITARQRAYRRRKEGYIKNLETRITELEAVRKQAAEENDRIAAELQSMSAILLATAQTTNDLRHSQILDPVASFVELDSCAMLQALFTDCQERVSGSGRRLLSMGAAWEMITKHIRYRQGLINIEALTNRLIPRVRFDEKWRGFTEQDILQAIEGDGDLEIGSDNLI